MVEGGRLYAAGMGSIALHHANAMTHSHSRSKETVTSGSQSFAIFLWPRSTVSVIKITIGLYKSSLWSL